MDRLQLQRHYQRRYDEARLGRMFEEMRWGPRFEEPNIWEQKMRLQEEEDRLRWWQEQQMLLWQEVRRCGTWKVKPMDPAMIASFHEAGREQEKREQAMVMRLPEDGNAVGDVVSILCSSNVKFLISGIGDEVPVSYLEGKAVGLYFYKYGTSDRVFFELIHMYKKLREMGENFELVFICMHRDCPDYGLKSKSKLLRSHEQSIENGFNKYFHGHTWLASPFSQTKSNKKLYQWAGYLKDCAPPNTNFVIIRPGENIAHTCAMDIYRAFGIEAYPFSKSRAAEIEVARLQSLTLDAVLFSGADDKFVYDRDGQEISASHLVGKNILLFLTIPHEEESLRGRDELMYERVIEWCIERKRHDESFEMLRVLYRTKYDENLDQTHDEAFKRYYGKITWLEFPYNKYDMDALYSKLLKAEGNTYLYAPMCVAFGRDGRFITMKSAPCRFSNSDDNDCLNFFSAGDLHAQVFNYIAVAKKWST